MARDNYSKVYSSPTGNELEHELCNVFGEYIEKTTGTKSVSQFRWSTHEEDTKLGTDAFIYGLPVDFTYNFFKKDHTVDTRVGFKIPGVGDIRFGVRTGNFRVDFQTPVLVIGIDVGRTLKRKDIKTLIGIIKSSVGIGQIIDKGTDAYWDLCDQLQKEVAI